MNGQPAGRQELIADGHVEEMTFNVNVEHSSWVALRILPSSHTNPVFVEVDGKPIRASRKSAEWCLAGVKKCRGEKERVMGPDEREAFQTAYDHAEAVYTRLIQECGNAGGPH